MNPADQREQLERVRGRFTRSAASFAKFALATRTQEAERLAQLSAAKATDVVLDVACGPGTFALTFAPQVKFVCGLDLTPAILAQAQRAASEKALKNIVFVCGNAAALPYPDSTFDLATCGYSLHHMTDPLVALRELARVLRSGGRLALVDLVVPEGADADKNDEIERARDNSHTRTLTAADLRGLLEKAGLILRTSELATRVRSFEHWMHIAGWDPADSAWSETRRLMEASIIDDSAGFHPRVVASGIREGVPDIEFVQTSLFVVAEKTRS